MSSRRRPGPKAVSADNQWKWICLTGGSMVIYFLVMCLSSVSTAKGLALAAVVCALAALLVGRKGLEGRLLNLPFLAVTLWVVMNGASTLYAVSGKFALRLFAALLIAYCCMLVMLALSKGEGQSLGRRAATALEGAAAIAGVVSIDLLSTRLISTPVLGLLSLFSQDYASIIPVEVGIRMNSMFNTPNVFAGCMGIGVFLSLGLTTTARTGKERSVHLVCLLINALAFLLAFSMGGSATIAVGFLVYLLLERKQRRGALLVLMVETLVISGVGVAAVSATSLVEWSGFQPIPMACVILGAGALWAADRFVGRRLGEVLASHTRVVPILVAAVLVVLAGFAAAAMQLTGPAVLEQGETLRRAAYPQPGTYTIAVEGNGAVNVTLESQNREDTMMHTSTVLYSGPADGAEVTIPEDSVVVYANLTAGDSVTVERFALTGSGETVEFPLNYTLLPDFVANRLQGLWANQNAIQRLVFFEDGMKLFQRSPVVGLGMGAFENGIVSVQSFYYETKYAHNHYVQTLVETGVVGLILFVGMLAVALAAVIKSRRLPEETAHPLTAALGGALVFMAGHGAVEVVFSYYAYLPLALGVLGLITLCCGRTLPLPVKGQAVKRGVIWGPAVLMLLYGILIGGNLYAKSLVERENSFDALESAIRLDRFEWADYMTSYVASSTGVEAEYTEIHEKAAQHAQRLKKVDSNTIPLYLAQYYFKLGDTEQGFAMVEKYVRYVSANAGAWQQAFDLVQGFYQAEDQAWLSGVEELYQLLIQWNQENMGSISLSQETMDWLTQLGVVS